MATRRYYLSRRARADLDTIASYLSDRSPQAARRVLLELRNTFKSLANNPDIGNRRDDLHLNVRMFTPARPANNYIVLYYSGSRGIEISDIIHAAQDWPEMFARGER